MGFRFGMAGGVACAVPAPPSARGVRTGPHGRDALLRVRGTCACGLGFAFDRLTRSARRFPARGKRKSPKRFCPLTSVLIGDTKSFGVLHVTPPASFIISPVPGRGTLPRDRSLISELPPTHPSDFDIIRIAFRFSEGSIGRELMRQHAVFHPATA